MKVLCYTLALDKKGSLDLRHQAKTLASSLLRCGFLMDLKIIHNGPQEIFRLSHPHVEEIGVDLDEGDSEYAVKYKARHLLDVSNYEWVLFLAPDCIATSSIAHWFKPDADLYYVQESGMPIQMDQFSGLLTNDEMANLKMDGFNVGTFLVRAKYYHALMELWESYEDREPMRRTHGYDQASWNRILLDTKLKACPLPAGEVAFYYQNHTLDRLLQFALIHFAGIPAAEKAPLMQAALAASKARQHGTRWQTRIFALSLPRVRSRRANIISQLQATGLDFEIIDGVDAQEVKPEMLAVPKDAWSLKTGEVACYLSHLKMLQRVVDYGLDYAIILEDDVQINNSGRMTLANMWHFLPEDADHVQLHDLRDKWSSDFRIQSPGERFNRVGPTNVCTWGYVVSRRFARFVLEHCAAPKMPIDHLYIALSREEPELKFYDITVGIVTPYLFEQSSMDRQTVAARAAVPHSVKIQPRKSTSHTEIINSLIERLSYQSYLEIGVGNGHNFELIVAQNKESVDPGGGHDGDGLATYSMTSDAFFSTYSEKRYDLIFIDGLHHAEAVERDIHNALKALNASGMVVCHDMNPYYEAMQRVPRECAEWTGDCWRAWLRVRAQYPDLRMFVLDTDYGVGIIYPAGKPLAGEMPNQEPSFHEFMRRKHQWLPLVPVDEIWRQLLNDEKQVPTVEKPDWIERLSSLPDANRPYLVYCPVKQADHFTDLLAEERNFDVAFNDYTGCSNPALNAEWNFSEIGHKWPCAAKNLAKLPVKYQAYAFWDNDIEMKISDLNALFEIGNNLGLQLYQAALSEDSITSYPELKIRKGSYGRECSMVEIMIPVFSRDGLASCGHTFNDSESGWGLDLVWPLYLKRLGVIDAVQARHLKPINSADWILSNGLTPMQEKGTVLEKHRKLLGLTNIVTHEI